jgi:hypothetical protein
VIVVELRVEGLVAEGAESLVATQSRNTDGGGEKDADCDYGSDAHSGKPA